MRKTINYLAFGDSLTVGYGAPTCHGFVHLYHRRAEEWLGQEIDLNNAGANGATTGRLLETLRDDPELRHAILHADLLTITAGGNDLIQAALPYFYGGDLHVLKSALQVYEDNYRKLLEEIRAIQRTPESDAHSLIVLVGLYNPLPQIPDATYWVQRFNLFLKKLAGPRVRVVDLYEAFRGREAELLYEDHIHPNELGYEVIAAQVESAVPLLQLQQLLDRKS